MWEIEYHKDSLRYRVSYCEPDDYEIFDEIVTTSMKAPRNFKFTYDEVHAMFKDLQIQFAPKPNPYTSTAMF